MRDGPYCARRTEPWLSVDAAHAEVFAFEEFPDAVSTLRGADAGLPHAAKGAMSARDGLHADNAVLETLVCRIRKFAVIA